MCDVNNMLYYVIFITLFQL